MPRDLSFEGTPFLVNDGGPLSDDVILLPSGFGREVLLEVARRRATACGDDVFLHTGGERLRVSPNPALPPQATTDFREKAYYAVLPTSIAGVTETDEVWDRARYFTAWHAAEKGFEPFVKGSWDPRWHRLCGPSEVTRFLRAGHRSALRNGLLAAPDGAPEMYRRLSWYRSMQTAWEGGWLRTDWRAWLADVACDGALVPEDVRRVVGRIHSEETAKSGTSPMTYGQALELQLPHLFDRLDRRALDAGTREAFLAFHVA